MRKCLSSVVHLLKPVSDFDQLSSAAEYEGPLLVLLFFFYGMNLVKFQKKQALQIVE